MGLEYINRKAGIKRLYREPANKHRPSQSWHCWYETSARQVEQAVYRPYPDISVDNVPIFLFSILKIEAVCSDNPLYARNTYSIYLRILN